MSSTNPDVTITLHVNTGDLRADRNGQQNIKSYISFTDTLSDSNDTKNDPTTFDTIVNSNAEIVWHAESGDGVDTVHLYSVFLNAGQPDPFSTAPTILRDGSENFYAVAKDVDKSGDISAEYSISFYINGDSSTLYTIDPKLQIRKKVS